MRILLTVTSTIISQVYLAITDFFHGNAIYDHQGGSRPVGVRVKELRR